MRNNKQIPLFLSRTCLIFTLLSVLATFLLSREGQFIFNLVGASSGNVLLGMLLSEQEIPVSLLLIVQALAYILPIYSIISFALALKHHYIPLGIFLVIDALIIVLYVTYAFLSDNAYGGYYFLLDAIVSSIIAVTMLFCSFPKRDKKIEGDKTGDGLREP